MTELIQQLRREKEFRDFSVVLHATTGRQKPLVALGLCEGAEFVFARAIFQELPSGKKGMLALLPDEKKVRRLCDTLSAEGLRVFPYLYRDPVLHPMTGSHEFEHEHLRVLSAILTGQFDVIVTTPDALLQYTIPPQRLRESCFTLRVGDSVGQDRLLAKLDAAGYYRTELLDGVGQYSVRGGIVDIFSPSEAGPVRLDFWGDDIDRMCDFDIMTQRQTENRESMTVSPSRELLLTAETRDDLKAVIKGRLKSVTNPRVKESLQSEYEILESGRDLSCLDKYGAYIYPERCCLAAYLADAQWLVMDYAAVLERQKNQDAHTASLLTGLLESGELSPKYADLSKTVSDLEKEVLSGKTVITSPFSSGLPESKLSGLFTFRTRQPLHYGSNLEMLLEDLSRYMDAGYRVQILTVTQTEAANLQKLLSEKGLPLCGGRGDEAQNVSGITVSVGNSFGGFELPDSRFAVLPLGTSAVRSRYVRKKSRKDQNLQKILSYADLSVGDYVVHEIHGIGRYLGMSNLTVEGVRRDFMKIQYAGTDLLYLPCGQLDKISKYIGATGEGGDLKLSKMGGTEWAKAKLKAKKAAKDMAKELIALYAERVHRPGFAFPEDDRMMQDFESAFPYEETDGQLAAIEDVKADMRKKYPMDRILCGDVGYGKTEVAMRAAFKAAEGGKQTAILVPTTILALQHYRTLQSRMRGFPVSVDMLSRFRTPKEQEVSLRKLKRGETDILVGTHRLLSKDVEFKDLGLLIVDEEQRFGVAHKEKLKQLAKNVDVLTLTATPIPRTMNMALSGIRDMSVLEEAPVDRLPVQSFVLEYDEGLLEEAVRKELRRGGQVFYLCNRIEHMPTIAARLAAMVPGAVIECANGKMDKEQLSDIWQAMVDGQIDILVTTTIIETGVDVPNANTLIVEDADRMGLSQLHQIRGRVGRSSRRAYAYFTYPKGRALTEISEKRLEAIRDFTEFGAGFRIAMRDMEIRGAGNLLGASQHGHMETIGYDLYMKLLSEAVLEEKGEAIKTPTVECATDLGINAYIPESYIDSANQRIDAYRKISLLQNKADAEDVYDELLDRYGDPPRPVLNILEISLIRALGSRCGMTKIERRGNSVLLYPEKPDLRKLTGLAAAMKGRVLLNMGNKPYVSLRCAKENELLDDVVKALQNYLGIDAENGLAK